MVFVTLLGSVFAVGIATMILKWAGKTATNAKDEILNKLKKNS